MPPLDDAPDPDDSDSAPDDAAPCQGDIGYQAPVEAVISGRAWIDAALAVLAAEVEGGRPGSLLAAEVEAMRVAAARRIARTLGSDVEPVRAGES